MTILALLYGFIAGILIRRLIGWTYVALHWIWFGILWMANGFKRAANPPDNVRRDKFVAVALGLIDLAAIAGTTYILYMWLRYGHRPYFFYHEFRVIIALHVFILAAYAGLRLQEIPDWVRAAKQRFGFYSRVRFKGGSVATGWQGTIVPAILILIAVFIFLVPLVPGVENMISKIHVGDVNIELVGNASRSDQISIIQYRASRVGYARSWFLDGWSLSEGFFDKRYEWYNRQFPRNPIRANGIKASGRIFSTYLTPYVQCVKEYLDKKPDRNSDEIYNGLLRLALELRYLALYVNSIVGVSSNADSIIKNENGQFDSLYKLIGVRDREVDLEEKAERIFTEIESQKKLIKSMFNKDNEVAWYREGYLTEKCTNVDIDGEVREKDRKYLYDAFAVFYITPFIADAIQASSRFGEELPGLKFLARLEQLRKISETEINYLNYYATRYFLLTEEYDYMSRRAIKFATTVEKLYPVGSELGRVSLLGQNWYEWEQRCASAKIYQENSKECTSADAIYFLRTALNAHLSAVNRKIIADYPSKKKDLKTFISLESRIAFRQLTSMIYKDAIKDDDISTLIIENALSPYAKNLSTSATGKFWDAYTTAALYHVFQLVADQKHKDNQFLVIRSVEVAKDIYARYIEYAKEQIRLNLPDDAEHENRALGISESDRAELREAEAHLVLLTELKAQLNDR